MDTGHGMNVSCLPVCFHVSARNRGTCGGWLSQERTGIAVYETASLLLGIGGFRHCLLIVLFAGHDGGWGRGRTGMRTRTADGRWRLSHHCLSTSLSICPTQCLSPQGTLPHHTRSVGRQLAQGVSEAWRTLMALHAASSPKSMFMLTRQPQRQRTRQTGRHQIRHISEETLSTEDDGTKTT